MSQLAALAFIAACGGAAPPAGPIKQTEPTQPRADPAQPGPLLCYTLSGDEGACNNALACMPWRPSRSCSASGCVDGGAVQCGDCRSWAVTAGIDERYCQLRARGKLRSACEVAYPSEAEARCAAFVDRDAGTTANP